MQTPTRTELYEGLKHGDEDHRAWLREAIAAIYEGEPVPPPRSAPAPEKIYDWPVEETSARQHKVIEGQGLSMAAMSREAREASIEIEWLRRLLRWCRPRLKHASYQTWLDKYLDMGPSDAPADEPSIVR